MSKVLTSKNHSTYKQEKGHHSVTYFHCYIMVQKHGYLTKATQNKLEAFEMWIYRRMMRISWTEYKSNDEVLEMTFSKRSLIMTVKKTPVLWTFNQTKWYTKIIT